MKLLFLSAGWIALLLFPFSFAPGQALETITPEEFQQLMVRDYSSGGVFSLTERCFLRRRVDLITSLWTAPAYHAAISDALLSERESPFRNQLILMLLQQPWPDSWQASTADEWPPGELTLMRICLRKLRIYLPEENLHEANLDALQRLLKPTERHVLANKLRSAYEVEQVNLPPAVTDAKELAMREHLTLWASSGWCDPRGTLDYFVYSKLDQHGVAALPILRELAAAKTLNPDVRRKYMSHIGLYLNRLSNQVSAEERERCIQLLLKLFKEHFWRPSYGHDRSHSSGALSAVCSNFDPRILSMANQWLAEKPEDVLRHFVPYYEQQFLEMSRYPYSSSRWNEIHLGANDARSRWKRRVKFAFEDYPVLWGVVALLSLLVVGTLVKLCVALRRRWTVKHRPA